MMILVVDMGDVIGLSKAIGWVGDMQLLDNKKSSVSAYDTIINR